MGSMKFDDIRQCGTRCKELGPITGVSIPPTASYEDVIQKAKQQFFAATKCFDDEQRYEYFLADPQGSKLINSINGKPWNLAEYIHLHGLYPSKTKIYCVQVNHSACTCNNVMHINFTECILSLFSVIKTSIP